MAARVQRAAEPYWLRQNCNGLRRGAAEARNWPTLDFLCSWRVFADRRRLLIPAANDWIFSICLGIVHEPHLLFFLD